MKWFSKALSDSFGELRSIKNVTVTGLLIAVSMVIESQTINLPLFKINFAFLAIAAIGMLMGPSVGFMAGACCDIVGYIASPGGTAFMPVYVIVAAFQGLVYGLFLYRRNGKQTDITFYLRLLAARLFDVLVINLIINTLLNLHYGYIHADSAAAAVSARVVKNLLELAVDIPLLFIILPAILYVYKRSEGVKA